MGADPTTEDYTLKQDVFFGSKSPAVTMTFQQWRDKVVKRLMSKINSKTSASLKDQVTPAKKKRLQEIHDALTKSIKGEGEEEMMKKRKTLLTAFFHECRAFSVNIGNLPMATWSPRFELDLPIAQKQIEGPLRVWAEFVTSVFHEVDDDDFIGETKQAAIDRFIMHANTPAAPTATAPHNVITGNFAGDGFTIHANHQGQVYQYAIATGISSWVN